MYVRTCVCMYVTVYIHAYKLLSFGLIAYDQICQKAQPLITSKKVICLYYQEMTFRQAKAYSQILEKYCIVVNYVVLEAIKIKFKLRRAVVSFWRKNVHRYWLTA